jgi:predicted ATPase/DNA-binding winged helix-turn-helix (wHTH) protein
MARAFNFGSFELNPERSLLLRDGAPVRLGSRAFALLVALVENAGQVVASEVLTARVWPNTSVSESNLRVHLAAIRKVLIDEDEDGETIVTIPGVGYRFALPVSVQKATVQQRAHSNVPILLTELFGRDGVVHELLESIERFRFISVIGSGGIGKTSVALAVSALAIERYEDGACFVDLTPLDNSSSLPFALASALRLPSSNSIDEAAIIECLRARKMLLVFDNCEHLIEGSARLAERVLRECPHVHLLTTSREPLRAQGEFVRRLLPLQSPPFGDEPLTSAEAMAFPAVQLFVHRATAGYSGFRLDDSEALALARLCSKLDGIPLAIELAAARADSFDIKRLSDELDNSLQVLTRGRRTAQERHRTLRATLDWSFRLLTESEQLLLARLGVFRSSFDREAALQIAVGVALNPEQVLDGLANLSAKSLLVISSDSAVPLYRLLESTRAYANEKLEASDEPHRIRRLHAIYLKGAIAHTDPKSAELLPSQRSVVSRLADEARAAILWAFSPGGDSELGIELITSSAYLWSELSLFEEYKRYADQALTVIRNTPNSAREELRLLDATVPAIYETLGSVAELYTTALRILELASRLGDNKVMTRGLHSIWRYHHGRGEYLQSLEAAEKVRQSLETELPGEVWWKPLKALSLLYLGRVVEARSLLAEIDDNIPMSHVEITASYDYNVSVIVNGALARLLWLQGMFDSASLCAEACVSSAIRAGKAVAVCFALTIAGCPISLWKRDFEATERNITLLQEYAVRSRSIYWNQYVQVFRVGLAAAQDPAATEKLLAGVQTSKWDYRHWENFSVLGEGFAPKAFIERAKEDRLWWCSAEILRLEASRIHRMKKTNDHTSMRALLCSALDIAQEQIALAWELRVAKSLLETAKSPGEIQEARRLLRSTVSEMEEGFDSLDFREAETLIENNAIFA